MPYLYTFGTFQVRYRTGNFQDTIVSTGRKAEALHGHFQDGEPCRIRGSVLVEQFRVHLGIAMDTLVSGEASLLDRTSFDHTFADGEARLRGLSFGDLLERDRDNLYLDIDTIE